MHILARLPSPSFVTKYILEELLPSLLLIAGAAPSLQTEVGQEEAICHTQSAFAQIDPESGGESRSWISPQKRREGFCEKAGRGGDQILANKESVKELILKKS